MGSDSGLAAFINTDGTVAGIPLVNTSSPVDWVRLMWTILLGITAEVFLGVTTTIRNWVASVVSIVDGVRTFISGTITGSTGDQLRFGEVSETQGLVDAAYDPLIVAVSELYAFNVRQFGFLAGPATVVIILVLTYIVSRSAQIAWKQLSGEGFV